MSKKNYIILAFLLTISIITILWGGKSKAKDLITYLGDYEYEIGTVTDVIQRGAMKGVIGHTSVRYTFEVNDVVYTKYYNSSFYEVNSNVDFFAHYIVIYNKSNPENSLLLGDYPINNNTEFQSFKEEFVNKIPY